MRSVLREEEVYGRPDQDYDIDKKIKVDGVHSFDNSRGFGGDRRFQAPLCRLGGAARLTLPAPRPCK